MHAYMYIYVYVYIRIYFSLVTKNKIVPTFSPRGCPQPLLFSTSTPSRSTSTAAIRMEGPIFLPAQPNVHSSSTKHPRRVFWRGGGRHAHACMGVQPYFPQMLGVVALGTISNLFPPLQITKVITTAREATMTFSPMGPPPRPSPRPTPATFRTQDLAPLPWDPWSPPLADTTPQKTKGTRI